MNRIVTLCFICIIFFSCKEREVKYNPEAIKLNDLALELMNKSKNDSALILLEKATNIDKNYYLAFGNKVVIYCERKELNKALVEIEKQIKAKPDLAESWSFAGMLYEVNGDSIKAKEYYHKSIKLFDKRLVDTTNKEKLTTNRLNRAVALILLNEDSRGKDELIKLKEENPTNPMFDFVLKMNKQDHLNQIREYPHDYK